MCRASIARVPRIVTDLLALFLKSESICGRSRSSCSLFTSASSWARWSSAVGSSTRRRANHCRATRLSLAVAASSAICNLYHQVGYVLIFLDLIFTIWVLITSQYANLRNWPSI